MNFHVRINDASPGTITPNKKKWIMRAKLTFVLVTVCLMQVTAAGFAQKVTLSLKRASLSQILTDIRKQTGYHFIYNIKMLEKASPVDIHVKNQSVTEVLEQCFKNQPYTFIIEEKTVIIKEKKIIVAIQSEIRGRVTDTIGRSIPGVVITVKGSTIAVTTDGEGKYVINVPAGNEVLIFKSIGFETKEIPLAGRRIVDVMLKESVSQLEEMVVIGYGRATKRDLVGSVGSVNMDDLKKAPVRSFEEALAGRVAGVQVTSVDGQPGSNINIIIRGANSITGTNAPLYVIDGFPIENPDNNSINPNDVESIEVLKDAAATAIYGARGSNGVIIVTTKSGKEGTAVVSYDGNYGNQRVIQRISVFDSYEFVRYQSERLDPIMYDTLYFNDERPNLDAYRNVQAVNWQDRMFEDSPQQSHSLSINGGTKGTRYAFSGNFLDQQGIMVSSGFNRYQGRLRLTQKVSDNFTVSGNVNYSATKQFGGSPIPGEGSFLSEALMYSVWGYRPVNGNPGIDVGEEDMDLSIDMINDQRFNPLKNYENMLRDRLGNVLTANGYGEYKLNDFTFRLSGGITREMTKFNSFDGSNTRAGSPITPQGQATGVSGSVSFSEVNNYLNENTVTYNKKYGKYHQLNAVAGFTIQGRTSSAFGATAIFVPNEPLGVSGLDEGIPNSIASRSTSSTLASFLGRVQYNYGSKYLATFSMRSDGSSKFAPGLKWGYFPAGGLAWRFSKEKFMKPLQKVISDAKLKATIGATGNNRVNDHAWRSTLNLSNGAIYPFGNGISRGLIPVELGNDELKWETTVQTDIGLELSFFDSRANLTVDAYRKTTNDLLLDARLPPTLGFSSSYKNIGRVRNDGLEFTLETTNIRTKAFSWTTSFNISFNKNKVLELAENEQALVSQINWDTNYRNLAGFVAKIGEPIGMFYGLIWEGNYQVNDFNLLPSGKYLLKADQPSNGDDREDIQPGDIKYRDMNGDGITNSADYTIIGDPNPDYIGGFSNNFAYKGFDLNVFFQWSAGNDVFNANRLVFEGHGRASQNMFATYADRWTPENPSNKYYRTGGWGPYAYSSRVIEDGSFLRLKTVSLGYQLPQKFVRSLRINSLRVNASAQNLFTWTKYEGYDPEVSAYNSALTPGFDWSVYPRARTLTLGLNLTF
ncbi:SusC/RagA family TonB-linked outer membrane protein [Pedobacter psychroterrae]|uniref:SusC/RagA family TonB-linked outer membrane protein n=2 Tax=Pedobacter psychroterrae TaxID=2530453 RepID=A0A4V2MKI6_9SPHI|nr:SusC/RagA family TonB-linked outer membrane protein [Pedobacter psychroterrae]